MTDIPAQLAVDEVLAEIAGMMSAHVDNWPSPKKLSTAISLIDKTLAAALAVVPVCRLCGAPSPAGDPCARCEQAGDHIPVDALLQWIEDAWPANSLTVFNQGVVRGFEIIRAQLREGHIQRYAASKAEAS